MSPVIDIFARAPMGPAILGWTIFGLAWLTFVALFHRRSAGRVVALAEDLERIALDGEPQRARIQAREAPTALRPLLLVLSGEVRPDLGQPLGSLISGLLASAFPLIPLLVGAWRPGSAQTLAPIALAIAVLLSASLLVGRVVLRARQRAAEAVRASCVELLEANVRSALDRERSAALQRRGGEEARA